MPLSREARQQRQIDAVALVTGLLVFAVAAYRRRFDTVPDAISYLEIALAYLRGDWATAVNAYWSPLYSWIYALLYALLRPSVYWEFALFKLANLGILTAAFFSYRFLMQELLRLRAKCGTALRGLALSEAMLRALGYALFFWISFCLLDPDSPDLLLSCFLYLAEGLLLRIALRQARWRGYALLGLVCGLGYLAKAVFFPLAFVFLFAALLLRRPLGEHWPKTALAGAVFLATAAPFLWAISHQVGHLTFGETGRLNYNVFVTDSAYKLHIFPRLLGRPGAHPTRYLSLGEPLAEQPAVYAFPMAAEVTYPLHYDPTRWTPMPAAHPSLGDLLVSCLLNFARSLLTFAAAGPVALPAIVLLVRTQWRQKPRAEWLALGLLLLPPLAGIGLYLPVIVHFRYVAHFVVVLVSLGLAVSELPESPAHARLLRRLPVVSLAATVVCVLGWLAVSPHTPVNTSWQIAQTLAHETGLQPGDPICVVGKTAATWAHMGHVRVHGEIHDRTEFQAVSAERKQEIYDLLRSRGFVALVDDSGTLPPLGPEWQPLPGTRFSYLPLATRRSQDSRP